MTTSTSLPPIGAEVDATPETSPELPPIGAEVDGAPPRAAPAPAAAPAEPEVTPDVLGATWNYVQPVDPEQQAKIRRLARDTGAPETVVAQNPSVFEGDWAPPDFTSVQAFAPQLAKRVADPAEMAALRDDMAKLTPLEWWLTGGLVSGATPDEPLRAVGPAWAMSLVKGWAGLRAGLERTRQKLGLDPAWTQILYPFSETDTEAERESARTDDLLQASREMHAKTLPAKVTVGTMQALPLLGAAAAGGAVGGFPAAMGLMTATVYGENVDRLEQMRGPHGERLGGPVIQAIAVPQSAVTGAIYAIGLGKMGNAVAGPIAKKIAPGLIDRLISSTALPVLIGKGIARYGVLEVEGAATMAAAVTVEGIYSEEAKLKLDPSHEYDTEGLYKRAEETFKAGLVDFALLSGIGAFRHTLHDIGVSKLSERQAKALEEASAALAESKTADRDPVAAEQIVEDANPGQTALVSREVWDTLWKDKGGGRAKAAEIAGDGGASYDAGEKTPWVALPLSKFLVRLRKTEHMATLALDTKLSGEARTPREEATYRLDQAEKDTAALQARGGEIEKGKAELATLIREQAKTARSATGEAIDPAEAAMVGDMIAESAGAVALKTGLDVKQAAALMGVERFRFVSPKAVEVAQAAHQKILESLPPELRAEVEAARAGDRRAQQRQEANAYIDAKTGHLNSNAFEGYERNRRPGTWDVSIDVNDLAAQDVLGGHAAGDEMLKTVAQAMRDVNVERASLYRRGGDEMHAGGFESKEAATAYAQRLVEAMRTAKEVAPGFKPSVSVGVGPDVHAADAASYTAKATKVEKTGRYEKGKPLPATLGKGESFMHVNEEPSPARGELSPEAQQLAERVSKALEGAKPDAEVSTPPPPGAVPGDLAGTPGEATYRRLIDRPVSEIRDRLEAARGRLADAEARVKRAEFPSEYTDAEGNKKTLTLEDIKRDFPEQLQEANDRRDQAKASVRTLERILSDAEGRTRTTSLEQVGDIPEWRKNTAKWMEKNGYTPKEIEQRLAAMDGQMKIFQALGPVELQMLPRGAEVAGKKGPIRSNQDDIYKVSWDASALCVKRQEAAATMALVQKNIGRPLSASEWVAMTALFKESGKAAPCLYCYVEATRAKMGEAVNKASAIVFDGAPIPEKWKPSVKSAAKAAIREAKRLGLGKDAIDPNHFSDAETNLSDAAKAREAAAPKLYRFLKMQVNGAKANKPKLYEQYISQILNLPEQLIGELNGYAGFRFFSSSDFQGEHVVDLMQALSDLSLRGGKGHAYTKVTDFVDVFGDTGLKIQQSIFAKEEGGKIVPDTWQGMDWEEAKARREKHDHVGTVLVATSDAIVRWGLEQPWVDYIIPYHRSGLEKKFYTEMNWDDFTSTQKEKWADGRKGSPPQIRMYELGLERGVSNAVATRRYLKLAEERGLKPVFSEFAYREDGSVNPNFIKLKKDYARTDTPFQPVRPDFDLDAAKAALDRYLSAETPTGKAAKEGGPVAPDNAIAGKLQKLIDQAKASGEDIGVLALRALKEKRDIVTSIGGLRVADVGGKEITLEQPERPEQYGGQHRPPRPEAGAPLHDLTGGGQVYPADVYTHGEQYYGTGNEEMDREAFALAQRVRGNPDAEVTVYRAVPTDAKDAAINRGDWVTTVRSYAEQHGERFDGGARIVEKKVKASEVFTNGDSILEGGYWPGGKESSLEQPGAAPASLTGTGPRGRIRMKIDALGRPIDLPVEILNGDKSTAFHEVGHFLSWAMHDVAVDPAGKALRGDYLALLKWAGYGSAEERLHANLERATLEAKALPSDADSARLKELKAKEERIGHGFEQYLAEGVSPSKALEPAFGYMREAAQEIYQGLHGIQQQYRQTYGQELRVSDEIRQVFDRWFAAESAVTQARGEAADLQSLLGAVAAGNRDVLVRAEEEAKRAAVDETYRTTLESEKKAQRESIRAKLREEIQAQVDQEPLRQLEDYLSRGQKPEEGVVDAALGNLSADLLDEHGKPFKLDRAQLVEDYGEGVLRQIPKGASVEEGGIEADVLARKFGYASGDEMIRALRDAPDRAADVEQRVQEKLDYMYPEAKWDPKGMVQAAIDAEHTPKAVAAALDATRILVREVDPALGMRLKVMEDAELRNTTAERLVSGMTISAANPETFLAAERQYAKQALELTAKALGKGEAKAKEYAAQAMDAREKQLLNMALYRKARDARKETTSDARYLAKMTTTEVRKELGKATTAVEGEDGKTYVTQPYLDRMDDLLGSIDFRKGAQQQQRAESFAKWLEEQPADARDDVLSRVSPSLVASLGKTRHWRDLTVQEMRDLRAAAEVIEAQAKLKSKLRTARGEREKEAHIAQVVAEIQKRFPRGGGVARDERAMGVLRALKQGGRAGKAILARPEEIYRELGPAASEIFRAISDAQVEASRLVHEVGGPIVAAIEAMPPAQRKMLRRVYEVDGHRLTAEALVTMALNWGNLSNRQKMVTGEQRLSGKYRLAPPISAETFQKGIAMLPREALELVNTMLKQVGDTKWEDIAALEKEFVGIAPPKIEAAPYDVKLADGTTVKVNGGYYPATYDPRFSTAGQRQGEQISQGVGALAFAPNYERAVTPQGHLQKRIESFSRPIDLSLSALPRTIVNHMRDLGMRRALVQTREIITDPRFRDAVQEAMGDAAYRVLLDHWRDSANETAMPRGVPGMLMRWADRRRTAVSAAVFAGNVAQGIQNFANPIAAKGRVPAGIFAGQWGRFMVERMEMVDRMLGESQYMTERFRSPAEQAAVQRSIAGLVGKTNKFDNTVEHLREAGMWWMETTDMVTATPAYFSFKEHAMRPKGEGARGMPESGADATGFGMSEADAIAYAESMIRLTHGGYRNVDKSAFERFVVAKPFTMFYSYMNAQLSQFIAAHADAQLLEDEGFRREAMKRIVKGYAWLLASGVAADLLVGKGPDDYDGDGQITSKDWGKYLFLKSVLYPPSTLPVVGGYLSQIGGKGAIRDPSMLPATRFAQASIKAIGSASKAMGEEGQPGDKWKAGLEALEAIGWYYGLPVVQTRRTGDFWFDILPDGVHRSEQSQAASPWQKAWDTMYGPTRGGSLGETFFGVQPGR